MTSEQGATGEVEKQIAAHPSFLEAAETKVLDKGEFEEVNAKTEELNTHEDFLNPNHPLYGTVDEYGRKIPDWHEQLTVRAIVIAAGIGFVFNLMVLKLGFTVGIIPSLNIAAGLLGFTAIKAVVALADKCHIAVLARPFTRQENTVIQTCVVACYGLAFSGGYTNSLLAMDWNSYLQAEGGDTLYPNGVPDNAFNNPPSPVPINVLQPSIGKFIGFMAVIYFIGLFAIVPLRRLFIIRYRLTYPSGTATGTLINGFHTPLGQATAKAQVLKLGKWFTISFIYSFLKWIFSGYGDECGFDNMPSLGLNAQFWTWYCDFSQTYIGIGLLVPKHITYGIILGGALEFGLMWPLIQYHKGGIWYPKNLGEGHTNIRGLYAYKVFTGLGLILGDGAYNLFKLFGLTVYGIWQQRKGRNNGNDVLDGDLEFAQMTAEQQHIVKLRNLRDHVFVRGALPDKYAYAVYVCLAAISMGVTPQLFPGVKAYYVLVAYIIGPVLGFCNAYGMGLSDWSLLTTYGKLCILIFSAWQGNSNGIIAGLAVCTLMQTMVGSCADLMQDFKTGWLTLSNPRSMLIAQLTGAALAVFISPATFWLYWTGFQVGDPNGEYKAPFAPVFRNIAVVAVQGSKDLPTHTMAFFGGFFGLALVLDICRDLLAHRFGPASFFVKAVPIPSMLGIPAFIGVYFAIDMTIGAVILLIWQVFAPADALLNAPIVASALIAGDGVWSVPSAILALAKVKPPLCMAFFRTSYYDDNIASLVQTGS